jgi:hypothetical protein
MKRARIAALILGGIAATTLGASGLGVANQATIKEMMGENFAGLQTILTALVTSNYETVPAHVDLIREHAAQLTRMAPDIEKANRDKFLSYAYNLQGHAVDVKSIVEVLIERDKTRAGAEELATDQLREALAAHYGGMVTMCVRAATR